VLSGGKRGVGRAGLAIVALAFAAPAQAATSLAHVEDAQIALAGDTAVFERDSSDRIGVLAVPLDASSRAQTHLVVSGGSDEALVYLSGSAQRVGIVTSVGDESGDNLIEQLFSGPPAGPGRH
jgi:hypothetical protein